MRGVDAKDCDVNLGPRNPSDHEVKLPSDRRRRIRIRIPGQQRTDLRLSDCGQVVEIGLREEMLAARNETRLSAGEEAKQFVKRVRRQLDQLVTVRGGKGDQRAPAVEWFLHQLEVGVVGRS